MKAIITKHGKQRIKVRLGLPKRAQLKYIQKVLKEGFLFSREGFKKFQVVYHGFLYLFTLGENLQPVLVTTYEAERRMCLPKGVLNA